MVSNFNTAMGQFQQELMRWNRQINLVSRQDTLKQVALLIGQCRDAWQALATADLAAWDPDEPVSYFDLGSGGGLPGFVWHQLLGAQFSLLETFLVEPREKRAWFLERLRAIEPSFPFRVLNGRWGEVGVESSRPVRQILISLKALRLSDPVVLAGLVKTLGPVASVEGGRVVIARFYPPAQKWGGRLNRDLAPLAGPTEIGTTLFRPVKCYVLPPAALGGQATALVVSSYGIGVGSK